MADDGNESRISRMDLNLYLGLPLSPLPLARDLGSDLALSSLPLSPSFHPPTPMSPMSFPFEPSESDSHNSSSVQDLFDQILVPNILSELTPVSARETEPIIIDDESQVSLPRPFRGEVFRQEFESTVRQDLLQYPEYRFQRLFESTRRWEVRMRAQSSHQNDGTTSNSVLDPATDPERLMLDILSSGRFLRTNGKRKVRDEDKAVEHLKLMEEKSIANADFECNICLDVAKEPVVTSCGHLFCWPCLYRWLHLHQQECPLCKGEVNESNVVPIYGRGGSETNMEKKLGEGSDLMIPPRPRGNRVESLRQQLQRPILRRFGEGVVSSLRRFLDEVWLNGARPEGAQDIIDDAARSITTRMLHRVRREEGSPQSVPQNRHVGSARNSVEDTQIRTMGLPLQDGSGRLGDRSSSYFAYGRAITDGLAATGGEIGRIMRRLRSASTHARISTTSANMDDPELLLHHPSMAADAAAASSTMAVIQGDAGNLHDHEQLLVQPAMAADSSSSMAVIQGDTVNLQDPMSHHSQPSMDADRASASSTTAMIHGDISNYRDPELAPVEPSLAENWPSTSRTPAAVHGDTYNFVPEPILSQHSMAADQASASSTVAVIMGDIAGNDDVEESNRGGTRNWTSDSWTVDGVHHACQRRRLN